MGSASTRARRGAASAAPRRGLAAGFQFTELPEDVSACGVLFTARSQYVCHEQFKLKLDCVRRGGSLLAEIQFDPRCFDGEDVRGLAESSRRWFR